MGRWATPLIGLSLIWEVFLILDFTLPSIFHKAAEVAIGGEIVAIAVVLLRAARAAAPRRGGPGPVPGQAGRRGCRPGPGRRGRRPPPSRT